jgi:hypothetical protein
MHILIELRLWWLNHKQCVGRRVAVVVGLNNRDGQRDRKTAAGKRDGHGVAVSHNSQPGTGVKRWSGPRCQNDLGADADRIATSQQKGGLGAQDWHKGHSSIVREKRSADSSFG